MRGATNEPAKPRFSSFVVPCAANASTNNPKARAITVTPSTTGLKVNKRETPHGIKPRKLISSKSGESKGSKSSVHKDSNKKEAKPNMSKLFPNLPKRAKSDFFCFADTERKGMT